MIVWGTTVCLHGSQGPAARNLLIINDKIVTSGWGNLADTPLPYWARLMSTEVGSRHQGLHTASGTFLTDVGTTRHSHSKQRATGQQA